MAGFRKGFKNQSSAIFGMYDSSLLSNCPLFNLPVLKRAGRKTANFLD